MSNKQSKNNIGHVIQTLQDNWNDDQLREKLKEWYERHPIESPPSDNNNNECLISPTRMHNKYASIHLRGGKHKDYQCRLYILEAHLDGRIPKDIDLFKLISSHICNKGKDGCFRKSHIRFEYQQTNMKRLHDFGCNRAVTCKVCKTKQHIECLGHGEGIPNCIASIATQSPDEIRQLEIIAGIESLQAELVQINQRLTPVSLPPLLEHEESIGIQPDTTGIKPDTTSIQPVTTDLQEDTTLTTPPIKKKKRLGTARARTGDNFTIRVFRTK